MTSAVSPTFPIPHLVYSPSAAATARSRSGLVFSHHHVYCQSSSLMYTPWALSSVRTEFSVLTQGGPGSGHPVEITHQHKPHKPCYKVFSLDIACLELQGFCDHVPFVNCPHSTPISLPGAPHALSMLMGSVID